MKRFWQGVATIGLAASLNLVSGAGRTQDAPNAALTEIAKLADLPLYTKDAKDGDYRIAPPYADAPEKTARADVPKGMVYHFTMNSTDSKIYTGIAKNRPGEVVPYTRRVTVYVPAQYVAGTAAPFLVSQDSMGQGQIPTILDNMIADHIRAAGLRSVSARAQRVSKAGLW